jgi:hypothetical protein
MLLNHMELDPIFSDKNLNLEKLFDFNEDFNQEESLRNTEETEQIEHGK